MTNKNPEFNKPRGHDFDGIDEYDNDLPRWWVNLFKVTVVFSIAYLAWYHLPFFPSKSLEDEYKEAVGTANEVAAANAASENLSEIVKDPAAIAKGQEVFSSTCASCHGPAGQGLIGPNLTDNFWLHGNTLNDVKKAIADGIPAKGMPAWGSVLGNEKVVSVLAYISSIQGKVGENPKAAQGQEGTLQ